MRTTADDRQSSFFADDPAPPKIVKSIERPFDPTRLCVSEWNGEGYVTATDACAAISYGEVIHFREFVKRLNKSEQWGLLSYRAIPIRSGKGGVQLVEEPYLTEKQLAIIYMRCDLPNMAEVRSLIADVFIAYKNGKLRPADAKTETYLLGSTDRAIDAAPEAMSLISKTHDGVKNTNEKLDRLEKYLVETHDKLQRSFDENVRQPRADELSSVVWQQHYVVAEHLDCWCPICRKIKILTVIERGADGLVSKVEKTDHYEHAHLLLRTVRGLFNTMPMCRQCNQTWERKLRHREWVVERVRSFHRLLREVWGILDLEGEQ
jgi:hypothetical protein